MVENAPGARDLSELGRTSRSGDRVQPFAKYQSEECTAMITAREVAAARFDEAKGRDGFDVVAVDDFLDRVIETLEPLDRGQKVPSNGLTSHEIVETDFPVTSGRGGYDMDQVDDLLDKVAQRLYVNEKSGDSSDERERGHDGEHHGAAAGAAGAAGLAGAGHNDRDRDARHDDLRDGEVRHDDRDGLRDDHERHDRDWRDAAQSHEHRSDAAVHGDERREHHGGAAVAGAGAVAAGAGAAALHHKGDNDGVRHESAVSERSDADFADRFEHEGGYAEPQHGDRIRANELNSDAGLRQDADSTHREHTSDVQRDGAAGGYSAAWDENRHDAAADGRDGVRPQVRDDARGDLRDGDLRDGDLRDGQGHGGAMAAGAGAGLAGAAAVGHASDHRRGERVDAHRGVDEPGRQDGRDDWAPFDGPDAPRQQPTQREAVANESGSAQYDEPRQPQAEPAMEQYETRAPGEQEEIISYPATDHRVPLPGSNGRSRLSEADVEAGANYHPEYSEYAGSEQPAGAAVNDPNAGRFGEPGQRADVDPSVDSARRDEGFAGTARQERQQQATSALPLRDSATGQQHGQAEAVQANGATATDADGTPVQEFADGPVNLNAQHGAQRPAATRDDSAAAGIGRPEPIDKPESIDKPRDLPKRDDTSKKGLLRRIFKG